jgi:hypothetical protein
LDEIDERRKATAKATAAVEATNIDRADILVRV